MQEPERPAQARKLSKDDVKRPSHILSEDDPDLPASTVAEEQQDSNLEAAHTHIAYLSHPGFRPVGTGRLEATEFVEAPHTNLERAHHLMKRLLIGVPLATTVAERERLPKF